MDADSDSFVRGGMAGQEKLVTLSAREREIAVRSMRGITERRIADDLGLSRHTVHTYMGRVYRKLHVHNRVELVAMLLRPPSDE